MNNDTLKFGNKFHVEDRLGKFDINDVYITFKEHKPNFKKLQSRLINPSKLDSDLGIISKDIQNIVLNIQKNSP